MTGLAGRRDCQPIGCPASQWKVLPRSWSSRLTISSHELPCMSKCWNARAGGAQAVLHKGEIERWWPIIKAAGIKAED